MRSGRSDSFTQLPNAIFLLFPLMKEAEMRVTMAIARETLGWHRQTAELSLTDLMKITGLTRQGVYNGLSDGLERQTILRTAKGQGFEYRLNTAQLVNEVDQSTKLTSQRSRPVLVNEVDQSSQRSRPVLVNEVDQQQPVNDSEECDLRAPKERLNKPLNKGLNKESNGGDARTRTRGPEKPKKAGKKTKSPANESERLQVEACFEYWVSHYHKRNARLVEDSDRWRATLARLRDGFSVEEIKSGIRGIAYSPHHQGQNDRNTVYDDLFHVCKSPENLEKFIRLDSEPTLALSNGAGALSPAGAATRAKMENIAKELGIR